MLAAARRAIQLCRHAFEYRIKQGLVGESGHLHGVGLKPRHCRSDCVGRLQSLSARHVAGPGVDGAAQKLGIGLAAVSGQQGRGSRSDRVGDRAPLTAADLWPAFLHIGTYVLVPRPGIPQLKLADRQACLDVEGLSLAGCRPQFGEPAFGMGFRAEGLPVHGQ